MNTLNAIWIIVSAQLSGQDITASFQNEKLEIMDGAYKIWSGENISDSGILSYPSGNAMDIKGTNGPNKGKVFTCIYKMESEQLTICYNLAQNGIRPTEFVTTFENKFILITYQKKK